MREIAVIGIGQTSIGEHWERSLRDLAGEAVLNALQDAGREHVDGIYIGNMLSGILNRQENLGSLVSDWVGLRHIEAVKVEAACGSGAAALRLAMMAVGSGELDSAIALGVEKMTETVGADTTAALAEAADADYETMHGVTFVALNALVMKRYMYEYHWQHKDFAPFPINAHANALHNPYARLHERIDLKTYESARMISNPINLMDASPIGDGAAAVLIVPAESLNPAAKRITIAGSASATDTLAVHDRQNVTRLAAAERSARSAYAQAGIGPQDIDFFELHDAFSIMAVLSLEACGFSECGQGPRLGLDGQIGLDGEIPLCTLGGLKARGHPVGGTGIYQIVEVVQQLRGSAGHAQVDGAQVGMAQNIGGSGATVITHILRVK
ncbi:MAG: thiolase domain-containing protein [Anaerolineales bacterium]